MTYPDSYSAGQNPVTDIRPRVQRIEPQMGDHARQLQAAARPVETPAYRESEELTAAFRQHLADQQGEEITLQDVLNDHLFAKLILWRPYLPIIRMCDKIMDGDKPPQTGDELARRLSAWAEEIEAEAMKAKNSPASATITG